MQKKRKLKNGVTVYELDEPVELIVKTRAPMKWKRMAKFLAKGGKIEKVDPMKPTKEQLKSWTI